MDKYKVKVNPRAIRELDSIYEYIANEKLSPENAKGQDARIKKAILRFEKFVFAKLYTGGFSKKLYRLFEYAKN